MQYVLYVAILIVLAASVCWINDLLTDALWRWRNPPEKISADRRDFEQRLLHPDWPFYERHLQRPVPSALRELFADHKLLLNNGLKYDSYYISSFEPLEAAALVEAREWVGCDLVPFANSDGDSIYLKPGRDEPDAVFILYHDGGDSERLAPDVSSFVQRIRLSCA